jgi:hypothetical protein
MGFEKNYLEIDLSTDSTFDVVLEAENNIVYAFGTATGNVAIGVDGGSTPRKGMKVEFIYDGVMGANTLTVFGTNIPVASDNVKGLFNFYYNGTAWLPLFNPSTDTAYINNGQVRADAAITLNKLATLTANRAVQTGAGGITEASPTTTTDLAKLSAISVSASQLNNVGATTALTADLNLLATLAASGLTTAELSYLIGVTSNLQTQLNAKANTADFSGLIEIRSFSVTIPSASVLDIFSTPVALVPAQGANTIIVPISIQGQMIYGTTPYATDGEIDIYCGGTRQVWGFPADDGFLFGTVSRVVNGFAASSNSVTDTQYVANQPLTIKTVGSNPTAGDSTLVIFGTYLVLTV